MFMRRLIINADDFGRSKERNKAIDDSFKMGLISSAGLIVTGRYLQDALEYINNGKYIDRVHLHLNLSTSLRDGDPEDVPLTEDMRQASLFCTNGRYTPYKRLPSKVTDVFMWKTVYHEMVAQYKRFIEVTNGEADYSHIDFHLWYNLTWPVSVALNVFSWRYKIKSVRYIGMHQRENRRYRLFRILSWNPLVKSIPAATIDFYLSKQPLFSKYKIIELYCHPNYKEGVFMDDSPSYLKHDRRPMLEHIQMLNASGNMELVSWGEIY